MWEDNILESLNWRYAVQKFDSTKKVSQKHLDIFLESLRLTPSSFGLQPWKFLVIEDKKIKHKLLKHSYNQQQIIDASHIIVFCRKIIIDTVLVNDYIEDIIQQTWSSPSSLENYKKLMTKFISQLNWDDLKIWAEKQIYIALWNALSNLAQLKIDSCPMEWFSHTMYDEVLWLDKLWLTSVVILTIGYRDKEDSAAYKKKIRYQKEKIIINI